ncbi:MAG TPA: Holliday junction branch migration protein RuvA [Desulfuromonadales bacterium]|nr:Holliday junction branch migration protein RuvA [Desulfuromonadales bacterium]
MIALVKGELAYKSVDHVILDVNGVGYRLFIPLSTFYKLPDSGRIQLFVHTHVREDALHLYGFLSTDEKQLFALLISISGVGPRLAINILSHIPAADLQAAIADGDVKRLSALPGIGKKTAERLVLELKDKIGDAELSQPPGKPSTTGGGKTKPLDDVVSALVNLGYKENQARKILENMEIAPNTPMEDILKGALKVLVR